MTWGIPRKFLLILVNIYYCPWLSIFGWSTTWLIATTWLILQDKTCFCRLKLVMDLTLQYSYIYCIISTFIASFLHSLHHFYIHYIIFTFIASFLHSILHSPGFQLLGFWSWTSLVFFFWNEKIKKFWVSPFSHLFLVYLKLGKMT